MEKHAAEQTLRLFEKGQGSIVGAPENRISGAGLAGIDTGQDLPGKYTNIEGNQQGRQPP